MPAATSCRRWSASRRSARMPGVDPGMERLDPAVEHLRRAGDRGDIGHRQAGLAERAGRAAGRDELEARARRARGRARPGRSCRTPRGGPGAARAARASARPTSTDGRAVAGRRRPRRRGPGDDPRQQPMLDGLDPLVEASSRRPRRGSATASWATIGPPSSVASTRWTVAPVTLTPWASASRTAWAPGNAGRSVGWVFRIRPAKARERPPARRSACSPRGRRRPAGRPRGRRASAVVGAAGHEGGVDPLLRRPFERGTRPIGDDEDDLAAELAAGCRGVERPEVRPGPRDRRPRSGRSSLPRRRSRSDPRRYAGRRSSPRHDLADHDWHGLRVAERARARVRPLPGHDDHHPDPGVERRPHLEIVETRERGDQADDRRHPPPARVEPGRQGRRQGPRHVCGEAAAGDVGEPVDVVTGGAERRPRARERRRRSSSASAGPRRASPGRAPARRRSPRAAAAAPSVRWSCSWYGPGEVEIPARDQRPDEREAVAVEPARGRPRIDVAGPDGAAVEPLVGLDDADAEPREVELAGCMRPGMLGGLAADERTAGIAAAGGDRPRRAPRPVPGSSTPDRDVVEEEQRLGAAARDVVGAHRDQVEPDRVVAAQRAGDRGLRADAVGRGDENGRAVAGRDA